MGHVRFGHMQGSVAQNPAKQVPPIGWVPPDSVYKFAVRMYGLPDAWTKKAEALEAAAKKGEASRLTGSLVAPFIRFASLWADHDYRRMPAVKIGGKTLFHLINPPLGAIYLMLFGFTIPPRAIRGYQRGKEDHDYREVGDTLRRDLLSLILLMFGLDHVAPLICQRVQDRRGIILIDPQSKGLLPYSAFRNYRIESPQALKGILAAGNAPGLLKAVQGLNDGGVSRLTGDHRLQTSLDALKGRVEKLVQSTTGSATAGNDALIQEVFEAFRNADAVRLKVRADIVRSGASHSLQLARKLGEEISATLEKYAKKSRLPADIVSFSLMAFLTGWLPVWFNKQWNAFQFYRQQQSMDKAARENPPPVPFAAHPLNVPMTFRPLG
jgi:hypothetical protein